MRWLLAEQELWLFVCRQIKKESRPRIEHFWNWLNWLNNLQSTRKRQALRYKIWQRRWINLNCWTLSKITKLVSCGRWLGTFQIDLIRKWLKWGQNLKVLKMIKMRKKTIKYRKRGSINISKEHFFHQQSLIPIIPSTKFFRYIREIFCWRWHRNLGGKTIFSRGSWERIWWIISKLKLFIARICASMWELFLRSYATNIILGVTTKMLFSIWKRDRFGEMGLLLIR